MIASNLSSHKMGLKKSSSFSNLDINILDNQLYSPGSTLDTFSNYEDYHNGPLLSLKSSPPAQTVLSRPRGYSTTISLRSELFEGSFDTSPKALDDLEINHEDDEEFKRKDLLPLKESDLEVAVEMVTREMIMSSSAPVTYPCYISIKAKEELLTKSPGLDLILLVDIKENQPLSFLGTIQKLLRFLSENDRLALFTTQGPLMKRFPLRVMDEPTKNQLINEFCALDHCGLIKKNKVPLKKAFESTLMAMEGRRYKNHVSAILILTDTADDLEFSTLSSVENEGEKPLVHMFCFGRNHSPVQFQELLEQFEGSCTCTQDMKALYQSMKECLYGMSFIQAKNVNLSLKTISNREEQDILKIAKVYENKRIFEKSTQHFITRRDYFSVKNGLDVALEVELSKANSGCGIKMNSYFLELALDCQPLCQAPKIEINHKKELIVKTMPELLCAMPKQIDKRVLENFCQIKVGTKLFEAVKMANSGNKNQSIQSLMMLKKEIYTFTMFKSQEIHQMMKNIDWVLDYIQSQPLGRDSVDNKGIFCNSKVRN